MELKSNFSWSTVNLTIFSKNTKRSLARSSSDNQLEVLTTEHIVTSAQLNAACSDLAATKAHAEAAMKGKEKEHKNQVEQLQFEMCP